MNDTPMQQAVKLQRAGRLPEAAQIYVNILNMDPRNFEALFSLGQVLYQAGRLENAATAIGDAMQVNPAFAEGYLVHGIVLMRLQRREEALSCFDRSLSLKPGFIDALSSRATALLELSRLDEALTAFDAAIEAAPHHAISWNNRGNALVAMRRLEDAVESFDKALALDANLTQARENREIALMELGRLTRSPPTHMQMLFDSYAPSYETSMVETLGYKGHLHLRTLFDRVLPDARAPMNLLDLGCGTGLVGEVFKDLAVGGRLDGIDLSPLMIEAAKARGIYDELILGDLEKILAEAGSSYDLLLAADTMNYLGDLSPSLIGAHKRLVSGGLFIFAVEAKGSLGWEQTPANRFRHNIDYVRQQAETAGLQFVDSMDCTIRTESDVPVAGYAIALKKPDA